MLTIVEAFDILFESITHVAPDRVMDHMEAQQALVELWAGWSSKRCTEGIWEGLLDIQRFQPGFNIQSCSYDIRFDCDAENCSMSECPECIVNPCEGCVNDGSFSFEATVECDGCSKRGD